MYYKSQYNTQIFDISTSEGFQQGVKFLQYLLEDGINNTISRNDVHTYIEERSLIIEWNQIFYDHPYDYGKFTFVDVDESIAKEVIFPDNHIEYVFSEEEEKERMDEFFKENPGWVRTSYGTWTNEIENEAIRRMLEEDKKENSLPDKHGDQDGD